MTAQTPRGEEITPRRVYKACNGGTFIKTLTTAAFVPLPGTLAPVCIKTHTPIGTFIQLQFKILAAG